MKAAAASSILVAAAAVKTYHLESSSIAVFKHEDAAFTQGMFVTNRCAENALGSALDNCLYSSTDVPKCYVRAMTDCLTLYETAGGYGTSELRVIKDFAEGHVEKRIPFPKSVFAEGADIYEYADEDLSKPHILVGTWREGKLFDVRLEDHDPIKNTIPLKKEMWGLAVDPIGGYVWMTSGGSKATKYKLDKTSMKLTTVGQVALTCEKQPIRQVNELEFDKSTGTLWGNVWFSSKIYQFNPETGVCLAVLDLHDDKNLQKYNANRQRDLNAVWNGIAILDRHWLLFTGKLYDHIFLARYF